MKRRRRTGIIAQRQPDYGVKRAKGGIMLKKDAISEQRWIKPDDMWPPIREKLKVVGISHADISDCKSDTGTDVSVATSTKSQWVAPGGDCTNNPQAVG